MKPTYDPSSVEPRWYSVWEEAGAFRPELNPEGSPFCIVIPPPNVTGSLHMGHALDMSIQDAITRRRRMQGFAALWLPGADHAGIATQAVVERQLLDEGLSREELGREAFVEQVWTWTAKSLRRITEQMKTLGFSCDWTRERFTLDDGLSQAVRKVFVSLYEEGLIYRGERIINWSPGSLSAISDIEVEYEDEVGELVHIEYPYVDGPLPDGTIGITVATTRAETMLGDTGVAVHPDDTRYRDAVGKEVLLPLMNRRIPVVADAAVDPEFGTGAVKVTPAHDPTDFEIGERHGLPPILIMDEQAGITEAGGEFAGLDRYEARKAVKEALAAGGYLKGIEEHHHSVGYDSRTHVPVEPMLSTQWFVKVKPLVGPAIDAVKSGDIVFHPTRWENNYFHWMENLRDWCISRQLWWGHRIPAWYCGACGEMTVAEEDPAACSSCDGTDLREDDDVLDTWFSSALWPFSTLGWPDATEDLRRFYPNDVMVTGFDIIYFWVARMIKMGLRFMGERPFADVVIHGLVRAHDGRKMSKSLDNAIDPLDVSAEHGADALRFALLQAAAPGQDVPFQTDWVEGARRFGNKLWNAIRFALQHLEPGAVPPEGGYPQDPPPEAAWVLARLHSVAGRFDQLLDEYRFSDAVSLMYNFAWSEVFDWYLEMAKTPLAAGEAAPTRAALGVVLRDILKFLHPVMPFVTEELWGELVSEGLVATSHWPEPPRYAAPPSMIAFQELVVGVRRFRSEHGLAPRHPLDVRIADPDRIAEDWWGAQLSALAAVTATFDGPPPETTGYTRIVAGGLQAFIPLAGVIDVDAERARLAKAVADAEAALGRSSAKLDNPNFRDRAPAEVVAKEEAKVTELQHKLDRLRTQLAELG